MLIIFPTKRKHSFAPVITRETSTEIFLSNEYYQPVMLPRVFVKNGEKWIKHVYLEGMRQHVFSWSGRYDIKTGKTIAVIHCSEKDCIINKR